MRAKSSGSKRRARFEHRDAIALLDQAKRGDAAAEAAADHEHVDVVHLHAARVLWAATVRRLLPVLLFLALASTATAATIHGSKRGELIVGTPAADRMLAGGGGDRIQAAFGGVDRVDCGAGIDIVSADASDRVASNCEIVSRRLSVDPYVNDDSQHETAVEPDSASSGSTVVAVFQVGRREAARPRTSARQSRPTPAAPGNGASCPRRPRTRRRPARRSPPPTRRSPSTRCTASGSSAR